jgi:NADH:ubiquinone oxidoreductase subunit E
MELKVCVGSACHLKGSSEVVQTFQTLIQQYKLGPKLQLKGSFCMGHCEEAAISVEFNKKVFSTTPEGAQEFFNSTVLPQFETGKKK